MTLECFRERSVDLAAGYLTPGNRELSARYKAYVFVKKVPKSKFDKLPEVAISYRSQVFAREKRRLSRILRISISSILLVSVFPSVLLQYLTVVNLQHNQVGR